MASTTTLPPFTVRRGEPVLVAPAEPTPRETKPLSDLDDGEGMRFYSSGIHLYRNNPAKAGQDPAKVIRDALAKALVPYYPLAGRLREEEKARKLVLECDAQGVLGNVVLSMCVKLINGKGSVCNIKPHVTMLERLNTDTD
ncbi:hypothetical protein EJB05_40995, partial [Eragrostis curvula]